MSGPGARALVLLAGSALGCSCDASETTSATTSTWQTTDFNTTTPPSTTTSTWTTTTTTGTTTSTDPCATFAGCPPGPPAGGAPCHDASPAWDGWETWDDFAPSCDLCVAASEGALPSPIAWEPCDPLANMPAGCRQMTADWAVTPGLSPWGYAPSVDTTAAGKVLMQLMRVSDLSSPPWEMLVLAEADGPVRSAMAHLQGNDDCWLYDYTNMSAGGGSHTFNVYQGSHIDAHGQVVVGGAATELRPQARWQWTASHGRGATPTDVLWATSDTVRIGVARWGEPWQEVFSGAGTVQQQLEPRAWHDFVHWPTSDGVDSFGVMAWTEERGAYPFITYPGDWTRGAEGFGTDGVHMVWVDEEGGTPGQPYFPTRSIMVSPYTTDPAALAPVRLRSYPVAWPIVVGFTVGCGYAGLQTDSGFAFIVRLSDGWSWALAPPSPPAAGTWRWGAVYGITCDEVFVRGNITPKMNVARVRLDALGPGSPPD